MTEKATRRELPLTHVATLPRLETLTKEALSEHITAIERAVVRGEAQMDDYLLFIACRQELARRVQGHPNRAESASLERRRESCV